MQEADPQAAHHQAAAMCGRHAGIVSYAEAAFARYGDTYRGVGWTKSQEQTDGRYDVALDLIRAGDSREVTLLDFGCGASHLRDHMLRNGTEGIKYSGLDVSSTFLDISREKHPATTYYEMDVLKDDANLPSFDYVVMNGIFTLKLELSFEEMREYFEELVAVMFQHARHGLCFNAMSKQVEWERADLFHLPFDVVAPFLTKRVSRHFVFRHDYGLYEYMTYVYRNPRISQR